MQSVRSWPTPVQNATHSAVHKYRGVVCSIGAAEKGDTLANARRWSGATVAHIVDSAHT
jgi:hypothetical protein